MSKKTAKDPVNNVTEPSKEPLKDSFIVCRIVKDAGYYAVQELSITDGKVTAEFTHPSKILSHAKLQAAQILSKSVGE